MGQRETREQEICTFQLYEGADYLTVDTGFMGISIPFSLPEETAAYLRGLTE